MITNLDPKPWFHPLGHRLPENGDGRTMPFCRHDPRPEFDVGDNPILQDMAHRVAIGRDVFAEARVFLLGMTMQDILQIGAPEQIAHARTVLEAIVREEQA